MNTSKLKNNNATRLENVVVPTKIKKGLCINNINLK